VQLAASYSWTEWSAFAAVSVVAGIAFAAVNQALVAAFGGAGRWVAALVGVLAVATGVVSTAPGVLSDIAGFMPTAPAYQGMVAALTSASGIGAAFGGLVIWTLAGLAVTMIAVARRRTASARDLLTATPVTA
jgi:putative membrane protein